ncbi:hypothetical protein RRG08_047256 [Elysia crispata]|nr:hypothetical protein RRG08_047256 [Elysia crispata]
MSNTITRSLSKSNSGEDPTVHTPKRWTQRKPQDKKGSKNLTLVAKNKGPTANRDHQLPNQEHKTPRQMGLLGGILKLETEVDQLKTKVGEVDEKITNSQDGEFTDKMIDAVRSITRDQNKEIKTIVEKKTMEQRDVSKEMVLKIVGEEKRKMERELEEGMKRKTNLIIFS